MYNSITHFNEFGVEKIKNRIKNFIEEGKDIADLVIGLQEDVFELGRNIVAEVIEDIDDLYRDSDIRKQSWEIIRKDTNSILTSFGNIEYKRTYFKSKKDGTSKYLADLTVGIDPHERMSADVEINAIEEAIESSYRKGGEKASFVDEVSKQTVMSKIHQIEVVEPKVEVENKKKVKLLYVEADEDHVSLQKFKGEQVKNNRYKSNSYISKLVYVHEGIDDKKSANQRKVLKNVRYFADENSTEELWLKVCDYIYNNYDQDFIETIYLSGDGAAWIKQGVKWIVKSKFVLDNHHQNKYVKTATAHLEDDEEYEEIRDAIRCADKQRLKESFGRILDKTEVETKRESVKECYRYLKNNWEGIKIKVEKGYEIVGCSAEGHISHILSNRLSSRPKGWSKKGVKQIAKLIVYSKNGGKIYDLVMAQKIKQKREEQQHLQDELIRSLRTVTNRYDTMTLPIIQRGQKLSFYSSLKAIIGI